MDDSIVEMTTAKHESTNFSDPLHLSFWRMKLKTYLGKTSFYVILTMSPKELEDLGVLRCKILWTTKK